MNKKKLSVYVAAILGLTYCLCVLPKVSAWAQVGVWGLLNKLGTGGGTRFGFIKNNGDGTSIVKVRISGTGQSTGKLTVSPGSKLYKMKKLNNGNGYGFEPVYPQQTGRDIYLNSEDGLALYTRSKQDFKKLIEIIPGTSGVKVLTHKEGIGGQEMVSRYKLTYPGNGSLGKLEKEKIIVDRAALTSLTVKSTSVPGSRKVNQSLSLKTGIDPNKVVSEALQTSLD